MTTLAPKVSSTENAAKSAECRRFRPDIQRLRAIAVAMVVIYHLYPSALPGGFAGVDVFFVISGYLITGHLLRGYARSGKVGLADFCGRRARPAGPGRGARAHRHVGRVAVRASPRTSSPDTARQILASALYFQNWLLASDAVSYFKSDDAATPVAALLVAVDRGAVLPRLAAAVPARVAAHCGLMLPRQRNRRRLRARGRAASSVGVYGGAGRRVAVVFDLRDAGELLRGVLRHHDADVGAQRRRCARPRPRAAERRAASRGSAWLGRARRRHRVGVLCFKGVGGRSPGGSR